ncbi:MAG: hypothetical protein ABSC94_23705 [Polyangiaceae bacterium]
MTLAPAAACSRTAEDKADPSDERRAAAFAAPGAACGQSGLADCPLQAWMKANMTPSILAEDAPRLVRAFARLAELSPPAYTSWRAIALRGAESASLGDMEGARRACKTCHDEHRARYRSGERPLLGQ